MPRPRKDSEILPAKERMENAFWELLSEKNYRKISVTDVVAMAGVNRNSFYYHYSNMSELADSAIMNQIETIPTVADSDMPDPRTQPWRQRVGRLLNDPDHRRRLDRLALIAGPHSSPELIDSLRDFGKLKLYSILGKEGKDIDLPTDLTVEFTVGGMLAILRRWPTLAVTADLEDVLNEDVATLALGTYLTSNSDDLFTYWKHIFGRYQAGSAQAESAH